MRHIRRFATCLVALVTLGCLEEVEEPDSAGEARLALVNGAQVLGFENPASWRVSAGHKSSSHVVTQGRAALGVSGFHYTELTSAALGHVSTVDSTVSFDFRPAVTMPWGRAQLYVDSPSRGIHRTYLGQVALAGSSVGVYRPVTFQVPASVIAALKHGSHADVRFKIALSSPYSAAPHLLDNLHFGAPVAPNNAALSVTGVEGLVYVSVNGVRRRVFASGPDASLDVSSWFAGGDNAVRIQAIDTLGGASYGVQLRVDGQLVIDEACLSAPCEGGVPRGPGIVFDRTYHVVTPNRPPAQPLTVNGTLGGKLYLDDAFTGLSLPTTVTLPQGAYTVGVGVGEGVEGAYTGQYFEQSVTLGASPLTVTPEGYPALDQPNHTRLAILPIRTTYHGDETPENTGMLLDSDIRVMESQTLATRDGLLEPFSYNLTTWDVTVLPTVEDVPLHRGADSGSSPDTDRFLAEAGLISVYDDYDSVVFLYSRYTATGDGVVNGPCCFWGGGQQILFMNQMTRGGWPEDYQNHYLLHEALHDYESYNDGRLHFYNGADGLHGADEHGYHGADHGETDFLQWQRLFIRNQVSELAGMRRGVNFSGAPPASSDIWVGVFDTLRRGVSWSAPRALRAAAAPKLASHAPQLRGTPAPKAP